MKFVIFCDLLPAPVAKAGDPFQTVGVRIVGSAVDEWEDPGKDPIPDIAKRLARFKGRPLPPPDKPAFSTYCDELSEDALPLFPWLGGAIEFDYAWVDTRERVVKTASLQPIPLPSRAELGDASLDRLRHVALLNLNLPAHTDGFSVLAPFRIAARPDQPSDAIEELRDGARNFRYEAFVAGLSSLPAPIPHGALNLVRFAKLQAFAANSCLIAAPRLSTRTAAGQFFAPDLPRTIITENSKGNWIAIVPYKDRFQGKPIEAYCKAIFGPAVGATNKSFLDRPTQWVRSTHLAGQPPPNAGVENQDWLGKLPDLVADIFDLPRTLIDVIEKDGKANGSQLAIPFIKASSPTRAARQITLTFLMALRDVVGPGCMATVDATGLSIYEGPNGSPAYKAIVGLLQGGDLPAPYVSGWADLEEAIARSDADFRANLNAAPDAADPTRLPWLQILGGVLGPQVGLPAGEFADALAAQVAGDQPGGFNAQPLRRVVNAALMPAQAIAIQMALWRQAIVRSGKPLQTDLDSWCARAARILEGHCARGFRLAETIRRANIDLPWKDDEGIWGKGDTNVADTLSFKRRLGGSLQAYALGTLCAQRAPTSPLEGTYEKIHRRTGVLPSGLAEVLAKLIGEASAGRIDNLFATPAGEAGLSPDAHGVSFQIDRFITGDGTDFNEDLAGYAFLMRRSAPAMAGWKSLTSCFADGDPDGSSFPIELKGMRRTILAALPVVRIGKMPTATVTYNNRPVIGDIAPDSELDAPSGGLDHRIFQLRKPALQEHPSDEVLLPFLAYGAAYEMAPFAIANHGAVPVTLQDAKYPALVDLSAPSLPNEAHLVRRFHYLRRTGVGALNVKPLLVRGQARGIAYNPWDLPKETRTIAAEILRTDTGPGAPASKSVQTALLLSADDKAGLIAKDGTNCGAVEIEIGAPLTSLEDFDRWLALDEAIAPPAMQPQIAQVRRDIRTAYQVATENLHSLALKRRSADGPTLDEQTEMEKSQLQDPAVSQLYIRITRKRRGGKAASERAEKLVPWQMDATKPAQPRAPISLKSKVAPANAPLFDAATNTVNVAPGDVVVVELFAAVAQPLLAGDLLKPGDTVRKRSFDDCVTAKEMVGGYALFSKYAFALEAATRSLAAASHDAILARIVNDRTRDDDEHLGDIRLDFKRPKADTDPGVAVSTDAIGAITVGSQAWRWTGRSLSAFPFNAFASSPKASLTAPAPTFVQTASSFPLLWDVEAFAERLDETLDDATVIVPITPVDGQGEYAPVRISLTSPKRADIARYMRFRVTSHSRYEAAYRKAGEVIRPRRDRFSSGSWATDWVRVFRAAKPPTEVPKPGIRAVIPLTRAPQRSAGFDAETKSTVSGVLAVVDGAWFEQTGLTDWLAGGVEVAYRTAGTAAEFGPDPLVRQFGVSESGLDAPVDPARSLRTASLEVLGPVGHSYDTGTATGLYLCSSFFIRPPQFASTDGGAWWMGKLNFRRVLAAEGIDGYWSGAAQQAIKPVVSDANRTQAAITLHDISGPEGKEVTLTAKGSAILPGKTVQETLSVTLRKDGNAWRLNLFGRKDTFSAFAIAASTFDLRIAARRRTSQRADDKDSLYAWYEMLILARPDGGAWQLVGEQSWFLSTKSIEPVATPMTLSVDVAGLTYRDARSNTFAQISDATEGLWTQFLPNAETLARSANVRLDRDVTITSKGARLTLAVNGRCLSWLPTQPMEPGVKDQGLINLLLVTMRVESVTGGEEEAYIGLCHAETCDPKRPLNLSWFLPSGQPVPTPPKGAQLLGRILTVRAHRPRITSDDIEKWKKDPWGAFFPREKPEDEAPIDGSKVFGGNGAPDASLQIIEIYAPIPIGAG